MKKFYLIFLILQISFLFAGGNKSVRMEVETREILENESFELNIILENFDGNKLSIQPPDFEKDLRKVQGPFQSQSTSIINGDMTKSISFTYQFVAKKTGDIQIPPVIIKDNGKTYQSNIISLKVIKAGDKPSASSTGDQIFIQATISKDKPYLGEMVKLEYTLYIPASTRVRMPSIVDNPRILGFLVDEKNSTQQATKAVPKIYNGVRYITLLIKSAWITASSAGKQTIDPLILKVPVEDKKKKKKRQTAFDDPFFDDALFSGYNSYTDIIVKSRTIPVTIRELPTIGRPASFNGAVGSFKISASANTNSVKSNEAITLKTIIEGSGNISDIKAPKYIIPDDFEFYDPTVKINLSNSPNTGRVVIEQICIPRIAGQQKITGSDFSYFNPITNRYETIKASSFTIDVKEGTGGGYTKDDNSSISQKEVNLTGRDIRYIKKDKIAFYKKSNYLFSATNFYIWLILILFLPGLAFIINYYVTKNLNNDSIRRRKKASTFAVKKLKMAIKLANQEKTADFYQNLETTFYHYLADKFNISHTGIVLEEMISLLKEKGIKIETLDTLRNLLNKCASIRYAPVSELAKDVMPDLELSKSLINSLEEVIK